MSFAEIKRLHAETQFEVIKVEKLLETLGNRDYVLNYLMKAKNSVRKARDVLTKCILEVLADDNEDDE